MIIHAAGVFENGKRTDDSVYTQLVVNDAHPAQQIPLSILKEVRDIKYRDALIKNNTLLCKSLIAKSVNEDTYLIQAINTLGELDRVCNTLSKRLREWYGYYFPELKIEDHEVYARRILEKTKEEFMNDDQLEISMGPDINEINRQEILNLVRTITGLYDERLSLMHYLDTKTQEMAPNTHALIGSLLTAKLIEKAGSLKKLSLLPSSTIQLLGAEQALFRHLRNKRIRPPKHGLILSHPYVMDANRAHRGQHARMLAAKISIAAKVDYFKGSFIGDKLKEGLK